MVTVGYNVETLLSHRWRTRLIGFFSQRLVYNSLFWLGLLLLLTIVEWESMRYKQGFFFTLSNEIINVFFYAVIVYFNFFYLIPNYLSKNKLSDSQLFK